MEKYEHKKIEEKWAKKWVGEQVFVPDLAGSRKPYYALFMFPYPSAEGLHIGNFYCFTCIDAMAKYKRLKGFDVFEPFGFDAFGIHLENYALKLGEHPAKVEARTTVNFRKQVQAAGLSCDYTREVDTTTPEYYKWTQWIFTQLFERGLAYQKEAYLNWCPSCKTVLADEQIEGGECERCKSVPEKRKMKQWFFKITHYADRLLEGLKDMDWSEITKSAQRDWIGKSEGANVKFKVADSEEEFEIFTTRPDTLFGCTYCVLAPEHELVSKIVTTEQRKAVAKYIQEAAAKSELERKENKEKTGVFSGAYAINPANQEKVPIWIADYVLAGYGFGAIMAVPAHDERDFEFAKKFDLPIRKSIEAAESSIITIKKSLQDEFYKKVQAFASISENDGLVRIHTEKIDTVFDLAEEYFVGGPWYIHSEGKLKKILFHADANKRFDWSNEKENTQAYNYGLNIGIKREQLDWASPYVATTGEGILVNSGKFTGLNSGEAKKSITEFVGGKSVSNYKLRDWCISRQRYWGPPVPVVYCENCSKNKEQVLILHGWEGSSRNDFIPSLKEDLISKNYDVFAFDAPHVATPNFEEWFAFIEKKIGENGLKDFHLVGHSMGGHLAAKLAEKHRLRSLTLVAPVGFNPSENYFKQFENSLSLEELGVFRVYQGRELDIENVKNNVEKIRIVFGENDPWITEEIRQFYADSFGKISEIVILPNLGHMSESEGVKRLEFIENLFKPSTPGVMAVPENDLPVILPEMEKDWEPSGNGKGPLSKVESFMKTTCPKCGGEAEREADVMDNFLDSAWYFFRYLSPKDGKEIFDPELGKQWLPVDIYVGGNEHAVLHLMYTRFITMALHDLGLIDFDNPFKRFRANGMILKDGKKMSKSKGNVISPDEYGEKVGYDALKSYILFLGPLSEDRSFSDQGIMGTKRWAERVFNLFDRVDNNHKDEKVVLKKLHKTIKGVESDMEEQKFNTAIAKLMEMTNTFYGAQKISQASFEKFLIMSAVFLPALAEELWSSFAKASASVKTPADKSSDEKKYRQSIFFQKWPKYDLNLIQDDVVEVVAQVNGKVRDRISVPSDTSEAALEQLVLASEKIQTYLAGKKPKKVIVIRGKLVNIVI